MIADTVGCALPGLTARGRASGLDSSACLPGADRPGLLRPDALRACDVGGQRGGRGRVTGSRTEKHQRFPFVRITREAVVPMSREADRLDGNRLPPFGLGLFWLAYPGLIAPGFYGRTRFALAMSEATAGVGQSVPGAVAPGFYGRARFALALLVSGILGQRRSGAERMFIKRVRGSQTCARNGELQRISRGTSLYARWRKRSSRAKRNTASSALASAPSNSWAQCQSIGWRTRPRATAK